MSTALDRARDLTTRVRGELREAKAETSPMRRATVGTLLVTTGAATGAMVDVMSGMRTVGPMPISGLVGFGVLAGGVFAKSAGIIDAAHGMIAGATRDVVLKQAAAWSSV